MERKLYNALIIYFLEPIKNVVGFDFALKEIRASIKRIIDLAVTTIGLICISPIFLIVCVLVRIKLGSPIFFKQKRTGKDEKTFEMIKFRTMTDARDENGQLLPDTERFTKFGNFLRNSSLDELPELLNVIKGDMSLIGPKPLYPFYLP